ncbi:MAG: hypothetical protein J3K34DRAFT_487476 [Monoraphidium minutum]|nr:MAG: hypothetical protein J3K34DRAFT_487476 [Monoraphidium minutum]
MHTATALAAGALFITPAGRTLASRAWRCASAPTKLALGGRAPVLGAGGARRASTRAGGGPTISLRAARDGGAEPSGAGAPAQRHHAALEQLEAVERALHTHLSIPGIPLRLGVDTALGRVPFAGVFAYAAVGAYTLATAWRYEASPLLLTRMAANVAVDNGLRAVPLVGGWIAPRVTGGNAHNLRLLRRHLHVHDAGRAAPAGAELGAGGEALAAAAVAKARKAVGLVGAARRAALVVAWPVRRLPLWALLAGVVAAPLALGAGGAVFAVWTGLRWLGVM